MTPYSVEPLSSAELRTMLAAALGRGQYECASRLADRILNQREQYLQFVAASQPIMRRR